MLEELLRNPGRYRCGKNYRASHVVFPVDFEGQKYIVKKPRWCQAIVNGYYAVQVILHYSEAI